MKIAILYSGLPVFDKNILCSHKKYIWDLYQTDLYLSTYSTKSTDIEIIDSILKFQHFKTFDIQNFSNVEPTFVALSKKIISKNPETNPINTLSMFYKIGRCFSLIHSNYDIVIRNRLDVMVDSPLLLIENESVNVPCGGDHHGGLLDLFAFGSYFCMRTYCEIYNYIEQYITEAKQNFHPESLLRFHCNHHKLSITRFEYNLYLRGQLFNHTAPCIQ